MPKHWEPSKSELNHVSQEIAEKTLDLADPEKHKRDKQYIKLVKFQKIHPHPYKIFTFPRFVRIIYDFVDF